MQLPVHHLLGHVPIEVPAHDVPLAFSPLLVEARARILVSIGDDRTDLSRGCTWQYVQLAPHLQPLLRRKYLHIFTIIYSPRSTAARSRGGTNLTTASSRTMRILKHLHSGSSSSLSKYVTTGNSPAWICGPPALATVDVLRRIATHFGTPRFQAWGPRASPAHRCCCSDADARRYLVSPSAASEGGSASLPLAGCPLQVPRGDRGHRCPEVAGKPCPAVRRCRSSLLTQRRGACLAAVG